MPKNDSIFFSRTRGIQTGGIPLQNTQSYDGLDESYQAVKKVLMNQDFQQLVAKIRNSSPLEGLQTAFAQLTPKMLAEMGIPVDPHLTITTSASEHSVSQTTDAAATEQHTTVFRIDTVICVPNPLNPFGPLICGNLNLFPPPVQG